MSRGFLLWFIALGLALALLFAAYPAWDMRVAEWFFDPQSAKFPVAMSYEWNLVRRVVNWVPFFLLLPALFTLLRKLVFPNEPMKMAPSIVLFLLGSFLIGPGLTSNVLLKENWGRPRPNSVRQFAGTASFQPWWRPGDGCKRNCSFLSGEASQAFWTMAPASLAPPQIRSLALGGAVVFGTAVGALRVIFGRHFVTDVVWAGVITLAVIVALYRLLLDPVRRNDARLERGVERVSAALHRLIGAALGATGQHLHKRVACL